MYSQAQSTEADKESDIYIIIISRKFSRSQSSEVQFFVRFGTSCLCSRLANNQEIITIQVLYLCVTWVLLNRLPISRVLLVLCTCPLERVVLSSIARLYRPLSTAPCAYVHSVAFLPSRSQVTVPCLWHGQRPAFRTAGIGPCFWICFTCSPNDSPCPGVEYVFMLVTPGEQEADTGARSASRSNSKEGLSQCQSQEDTTERQEDKRATEWTHPQEAALTKQSSWALQRWSNSI